MLGDNLTKFHQPTGRLTASWCLSVPEAQRMNVDGLNGVSASAKVAYTFGNYSTLPPQARSTCSSTDEAHGTRTRSPGERMGSLASKGAQDALLTATLKGGTATNLFYLLFRAPCHGRAMNRRRTAEQKQRHITSPAMAFMPTRRASRTLFESNARSQDRQGQQDHVLRTVNGGLFVPRACLRCVIWPVTPSSQLKDIGARVCRPHEEVPRYGDGRGARRRPMTPWRALTAELKQAWRAATRRACASNCSPGRTRAFDRDGQASAHSAICWRSRPRCHAILEVNAEERATVDICREEESGGSQGAGLASAYTGTRDTTAALACAAGAGSFKGGV